MRKKLAICIPVYNRGVVFRYSLLSILSSVQSYNELVEIVISDDCSEEDIFSIVEEIKLKFPNMSLYYFRNETNLNWMNFFKVVQYSSAEFSWIVGSDDFLTSENFEILIESIINYNLADIYIGNVSNYKIDINELELKTNHSFDEVKLSRNYYKNEFRVKKQTGLLKEFINPKFNNVFLGAMMAVVFKTDIWNETYNQIGFNYKSSNIYDWYPHTWIFAKGFLEKNCFYINHEIIVAGDGVREWANEEKGIIEFSYRPFIILYIIREILRLYKRNGLGIIGYINCVSKHSYSIGIEFLPALKNHIFSITKAKNITYLLLMKVLFSNIYLPFFHIGIIVGLAKRLRIKVNV